MKTLNDKIKDIIWNDFNLSIGDDNNNCVDVSIAIINNWNIFTNKDMNKIVNKIEKQLSKDDNTEFKKIVLRRIVYKWQYEKQSLIDEINSKIEGCDKADDEIKFIDDWYLL